MKTILLDKAGGVENFLFTETNKPEIKADEVLIENKAISINPVDYKARAIEEVLTMICGDSRPAILGWDIAGTIAEVGKDVKNFKVGDKVFGMVNFPGSGNAYAEYTAAPENQLARIPDNISFENAAATTLAALTALQVLSSRIKKGDRVLIHAGAGGVGHYAIQIAKHLGAYVLATASSKNKDFVLSLGADEHIDYREKPFEEVVSDINFVLDGMGSEVLLNSIKVMKTGGSIISLPTADFSDEITILAKEKNVDVSFLLVESSGKDMNTLADMLDKGILKAHVSKTFPFDKMTDAHTEIETGRTVGKIVVTL